MSRQDMIRELEGRISSLIDNSSNSDANVLLALAKAMEVLTDLVDKEKPRYEFKHTLP